jgi:hypothetical protein
MCQFLYRTLRGTESCIGCHSNVTLSLAKPLGPIAQQIGNPWLNLRNLHRELEFQQRKPHFMPPASDGNFQLVFKKYSDCIMKWMTGQLFRY